MKGNQPPVLLQIDHLEHFPPKEKGLGVVFEVEMWKSKRLELEARVSEEEVPAKVSQELSEDIQPDAHDNKPLQQSP